MGFLSSALRILFISDKSELVSAKARHVVAALVLLDDPVAAVSPLAVILLHVLVELFVFLVFQVLAASCSFVLKSLALQSDCLGSYLSFVRAVSFENELAIGRGTEEEIGALFDSQAFLLILVLLQYVTSQQRDNDLFADFFAALRTPGRDLPALGPFGDVRL
eukprot:CAMPEP_0168339614 /NCGR_PEP_ID=MMETSP0213-20121227/13565_1 /TAXON_ID=151035 /ORGANISM="Euplotes harpa, Strain FSP1.4" /LENGTH=162 /DNA_ID=CAMNT_0008345677 /DNA_START=175 /DNA_END=663 /DNA_ORIENTATION=+